MAQQYVKAVSACEINYDFTGWTWEPFDGDSLKKMVEDNAKLVASEIFDTMTLNIDTMEGNVASAVFTTDAIPGAMFHFDLAEAVADAVEGIENDYPVSVREKHKEETRQELMSLRAKFAALVDIIDASPVLKNA
jgi:hypothetical protein